ncbi:MAG: RNA-binding cell elongation regulator Jag/EloR [Nitrospinota bacterium]
MDWAEAEGKTYEDAVSSLLKALGADKSEVEIEDMGKQRKFLGMGSEVVKVRGRLKREAFQDAAYEDTSAAAEETAQEPSANQSDEAVASKAFLLDILEKMGVDDAEVSVIQKENSFTLDIHSAAGGLLIGKRGETLEALQTIIEISASRIKGQRSRIVIDTENYRMRRKEKLTELAHKSAAQSVKTKKKVLLGPMKASERKIIHTSLKDNPNVKTKSDGTGENRQVIIFPVK